MAVQRYLLYRQYGPLAGKEELTDDSEIFDQTMTDKDATEIDEQTQLLVSHLQRYKRMR